MTEQALRHELALSRRFGLLLGLGVTAWFGLWPAWRHGVWTLWPFGAGFVLALLAMAAPRYLNWLRRKWLVLGGALGRVHGGLWMGLLFFFVLTPLGLLLRLWGRDRLGLRWDPNAVSYRIPRASERIDMHRMF